MHPPGPADKCGAELLDERGHILAQSVAPALVGLPGKQGDVIEPDVPFVRKDQMEFVPKMADEIKTMDARIFRDELMGLAND